MAHSSGSVLVLIDAPVYSQVLESFDGIFPVDAEVQILAAERDGVEQVTEILRMREVHTLHIVATNSAKSLQLGSTQLTLFNLDCYGWQLQQWGEALASDATIYLYSCNDAANTALSAPFLHRLCLLTGANIMTADHAAHHDALLSQINSTRQLPFVIGH
jgi:hypothetical protein